MILDEPTSSLDGPAAQQLLAFIREFVALGKGCILISHKLLEVFQVTDRVMVMRDGQLVQVVRTAQTERAQVVAAMGQDEASVDLIGHSGTAREPADRAGQADAPVLVSATGRTPMRARRGEVIGLAGLAGHGQTDLLLRLQAAAAQRSGRAATVQVGAATAFVLMDDPMRGVDVGTKRDVYGLIAAEAAAGRTFIWYTTEFEDLYHCDRICVFNNGRIAGELTRAELTEERVLRLSFDEVLA